jgi:hypothetical protein
MMEKVKMDRENNNERTEQSMTNLKKKLDELNDYAFNKMSNLKDFQRTIS